MTRSLAVVLALWACSASAQSLGVTLETPAAVSLTQARTQGGVGGGLGVSYLVSANWLVQGRAAWLWGLGSHVLVRAGGAWQRSEGLWRPMISAELVLGLGGALDFGVAGSAPSRAPTVGAVVGAQLLRFATSKSSTLSVLGLEGGVSTEFLSVGPRFGLTVVSITLWL